MSRIQVREQYVQVLAFERGLIVELKKTACLIGESLNISAGAMSLIEVIDKNGLIMAE